MVKARGLTPIKGHTPYNGLAFELNLPVATISLPGSGRPVRKGLGAGPFDAGPAPCTLLDGIHPGKVESATLSVNTIRHPRAWRMG